MGENPQENVEEFCFQDAQVLKARKAFRKGCTICGVLLCSLVIALILTFLGVHYFWNSPPQKIYTMEHTFFSQGEPQRISMKIDPLTRTEIFQSGKSKDEILEIHDFKHGLTGIFFVGDPKCFIRRQIKGMPETADMETEELEGEEMTATYLEQSLIWVPGEKPIENKDFLKNSRILDLCKNVTTYWFHPTLLTEEQLLDLESEQKEDNRFPANQQDQVEEYRHSDRNARAGAKRQTRQLTEEDLPVNDYAENGLEFHPSWDERLYCCARCRRAHRYCRRICEPMLGYYPYPYCYQGGRVICRIIMPCNWWIARMLGRV